MAQYLVFKNSSFAFSKKIRFSLNNIGSEYLSLAEEMKKLATSLKHSNDNKNVYIVDGCIGAGKSTFLNFLNQDKRFRCIQEPVNVWQSVGIIKDNNFKNLLELYYLAYSGLENEEFILIFQTVILLTRLQIMKDVLEKSNSSEIIVFERHPFSDR